MLCPCCHESRVTTEIIKGKGKFKLSISVSFFFSNKFCSIPSLPSFEGCLWNGHWAVRVAIRIPCYQLCQVNRNGSALTNYPRVKKEDTHSGQGHQPLGNHPPRTDPGSSANDLRFPAQWPADRKPDQESLKNQCCVGNSKGTVSPWTFPVLRNSTTIKFAA